MILERKIDLLKFMLENAVGTERARTIPPMVLVEALNTAQDEIVARLALVDSSYGVVSVDIEAGADPSLLMPERATTLLDLRYKTSDGFPGTQIQIDDFRYRTRRGDKAYPVGKQLAFEGPRDQTLTLWYRGAPWPMFSTTLVTASTTHTWEISTNAIHGEIYREDDYYVGGVVRITDVTNMQFQRCTVSDFVAKQVSNPEITVTPDLWIEPSAGGSVWTLELESEVPESLHGKLVDLAFARLTGNLDAIPDILKAVTGVGFRKGQMPGMPREIGV